MVTPEQIAEARTRLPNANEWRGHDPYVVQLATPVEKGLRVTPVAFRRVDCELDGQRWREWEHVS